MWIPGVPMRAPFEGYPMPGQGFGLSFATAGLPPAGSLKAAFEADPVSVNFTKEGYNVFTSNVPDERELAFAKAQRDGFGSDRAAFDYWTNDPPELRWSLQPGRVDDSTRAILEKLWRWIPAWQRVFPLMAIFRNGIPGWMIQNRPSPFSDFTGTYPFHDIVRDLPSSEWAAAFRALPEGETILSRFGTFDASSGAQTVDNTAPVRDTQYPVGVQLLSMGDVSPDSTVADWSKLSSEAIDGIIGYRTMTPFTKGQTVMGEWMKLPRIYGVQFLDVGASDPSQRKTGWYATRPASMEAVGAPPYPSQAERLALADKAHVRADEAALLAILRQVAPDLQNPAGWQRDFATIDTGTVLPQLPPGTVVTVPAPGNNLPPIVKPPWSDVAVPYTPGVLTPPAGWTPPAGPPPPVTVNHPDGTSETTTDPVTLKPQQAGMGLIGGLLLAGLVVGALVQKKKRPRGYTSNRRR